MASSEQGSRTDYPFSLEEGKPSPFLLLPGGTAVRIPGIPSQAIRSNITEQIVRRYPGLHRFGIENRLRLGGTLINGIDDASAQRLRIFFNEFGTKCELEPVNSPSLATQLWNPWLLAGALVIPGALFGTVAFVTSLLIAIALIVYGAIVAKNKEKPIISVTDDLPLVELELSLAQDYAQIIHRLEAPDADILKSSVEEMFDILQKLRRGSVISAAAGGASGELHLKLDSALRELISQAHSIVVGGELEKTTARKEMAAISQLIEKISEWWNETEFGGRQTAFTLNEELMRHTMNIGNIVQEVRPSETFSNIKIRE